MNSKTQGEARHQRRAQEKLRQQAMLKERQRAQRAAAKITSDLAKQQLTEEEQNVYSSWCEPHLKGQD